MRILLAVDGSVSSDRAAALVATLPLPDDSVVRIVSVQHRYTDLLSVAWAASGDADVPEADRDAEARHHREAIERAERELEPSGGRAEGFLLRGRPASSIVDEARAFEADLVVVGHRGHGTIATMVLGSTASEVVDHAPCPVLVARGPMLGPLVFADDGSPSARFAERVFAAWPIFAGHPISVLTVAEVAVPVAAGFTAGLYDEVLASYTKSVDEARQEVRDEAEATAGRLADAGLVARPVVLEGDPAAEIVRFATERGVGMVVMGTRGHTGLARLILGSVARNVLLHAPCSVLVVREQKGA